MRTRICVIVVMLGLFSVHGMAQSINQPTLPDSASTGIVTPSSVFYPLDKQVEELQIQLGIGNTERIIVERSAEVQYAVDNNQGDDAVEQSIQSVKRISMYSDVSNSDALNKAEYVLRRVRSNVPVNAQKGINNALQSVSKARGREINNGSRPKAVFGFNLQAVG